MKLASFHMLSHRLAKAIALSVLLGLAGCSIIQEGIEDQGPTLADLGPPELPTQKLEVPEASLAEIEKSYRAALEVATSPDLRHRIRVRLADIEMAKSENRQLEVAEEEMYFNDAISLYDELLSLDETQADAITDERLMYRLSKAYALDGRMDESTQVLEKLIEQYPGSNFAAEAFFRSAEQAFSMGDYDKAQEQYQRVIDFGESTPYFLNANYMLGWSQFKDGRFRASIESFTAVLDRVLPEDLNSLEALDDARKGLAIDTLRVLALTFTYLDGAQTITEVYANLGERHYQFLLYQRLGQLHLSKDRYVAAADTFNHFIEEFPNSDYGPRFSQELIEVYKQGGMAAEILPAKENFVRNYGINSQFWAARSPEQLIVLVVPTLQLYLDELSSFYHAEAQTLKAELAAARKAGQKRPRVKAEDVQQNFLKAADYYGEFVQTFPQHERRAEMTYLKADAYYEAGALEEAVAAYQQVAFEWIDPTHGAEAGYSAILVLEELKQAAPTPELIAAYERQKVNASISFADYYPGDARATPVLTRAAQTLFERGDSQDQAVELAVRLTTWQPEPEPELLKTAWLIVAHSQFDAGEYTVAEQSYRQVFMRLPPESGERTAIIERIAASMFNAAEKMASNGELLAAAEQLMLIETVAPGSDIAIRAQYDAGNYFMELKDWSRAEAIFVDFEQRFAQHELTPTLPPKLALIYQELKAWDKAAAVLAQMASNQGDPEMRRQSLYLSAELYEKSGRLWDAALQYANYVEAYPEPFDLATESRFKLMELATERGDMNARRRWLRRMIQADTRAGDQRTERSKYLAAFASSEFALEKFEEFERIKLTLPIKKSLKAKKKALDETLDAYKGVLDYGVAKFTTEANYRIGNVYSQLSRDLMDSERPGGLDALAMEQYEILLEEQAYPFEEKSIELLEANAQRSWDGFYDKWVKQSINELSKLLPARYGKKEKQVEVSDGLH